MASSFEKGGNPGIEKKHEWPPAQQRRVDPKVQQALGKLGVRGAEKKK